MNLSPAESILLTYLNPKKDSQILILEGGGGKLAGEVAPQIPQGGVTSLTKDGRDFWAAEAYLTRWPNAKALSTVFPSQKNFDIVLLPMPKGRRYTRTQILAAWQALKIGGQLIIAGPSREGVKSVIKDAGRLFGNSSILGYRNHQRAAVAIRKNDLPNLNMPEFQERGIAPDTQKVIEISLAGQNLEFETHPGIFSWEQLDAGTAFLLEHLKIAPGDVVWDVGCGYGALGLAALKAGAAHATLTDINLLAIEYARKNAARNRLGSQTSILPADGLTRPDTGQRYDLIVSNPAFHQGSAVDQSMAAALISQAAKWLKKQGRLVLVANRFLNYDKPMQTEFNQVTRIAETSKFHILEGRNL